jgi:hypothetical protein
MDCSSPYTLLKNTIKPHVVLQPSVDYDGMHFKVLKWHQSQNGETRYLIRYTRSEFKSFSTHALIECLYLPMNLLNSFVSLNTNDMGNPENQGGDRIRLQDVTRVLDMAWCSSYKRECSSSLLVESLGRKKLEHVFVLLEWNDEGVIRSTWECVEIFVRLMEPERYVRLLTSWSAQVDCRHGYLVDNFNPPVDVSGTLEWL